MRKVFLLFSLMLLTAIALKAQDINVTFQADMRVEIVKGYFEPASDVLTCVGDFNNWLNDPDNTGKVMSDDDNDSVYTITIAMAPSTTYGYKFNIGLGWDGKDEFQGMDNRSVIVEDADMTVDPTFFNNYTPYTGIAADVVFNVDMRVLAQDTFDPSTDHVFIAGDFTTWGTNAIEMDDLDGDTVYSVGLNGLFNSGDLAIYKFIYSATDAGSGTWESPTEGDDIFDDGSGNMNRIVGIVDSTNFISRLWNNEVPPPPDTLERANGNIFFEVDMSVAAELGVFDPNVDSVQIRGSFNGWNASDPPRSLLNQNPADPNNWFLDVSFDSVELNSIQRYKYWINNPGDPETYANTGWEVYIGPTDNNDRNRLVTFEGNDTQEQPLEYFDGVHPDWVIPAGTTVECEFMVDMTYATLADTQGSNPVFNPGTDTVYWIPRHPFYYAVNGLDWPDAKVLELTDPDQDMIYTGTLTIEGPNFNGFLYRYAYTSGSLLIQEDVSQGDSRVRFISQTGPRMFESPWTMPLDIWSNSPQPEEEGPVTSVEVVPGTPVVYALEQNYPNPFNPETMIRFSIPEQGLVTIKVYNLLGEAVTTLLNRELVSGTYEVDFNAAKYSSGIYFYTITANNYIATKKMILMK